MNIIDLCPVGALTSRDFRFKSRLWFMDFSESISTTDAKGCNIVVGGRGGRLLRIEPRENQDVNRWWMPDDEPVASTTPGSTRRRASVRRRSAPRTARGKR